LTIPPRPENASFVPFSSAGLNPVMSGLTRTNADAISPATSPS
jgi:hypothetical protein